MQAREAERASADHPAVQDPAAHDPAAHDPDAQDPAADDAAARRQRLEEDYRRLVLREFPARGRAQGWRLRHDHCLGRVVLDHVTGGCWYDTLDRRSRTPAFRQLDDERLAAAVALADRLAREGVELLRELDTQSLAWRGKQPWRGAPTRGTPRSAR